MAMATLPADRQEQRGWRRQAVPQSADRAIARSGTRLQQLAGHVMASPAAGTSAEQQLEPPDNPMQHDDSSNGAFPFFDGACDIDASFVQRFVTEGFAAILPDTVDGPEARAAAIHAALYGMVPPIVRSEDEATAFGYDEYLVANEEGRPMHKETKENCYRDNSTAILPQLDEVIEAPNVRRALTALLGPNYMVDSTRSAHYTIPNRHTKQDFHRDGSEKRRHHKPRMLMGLYYPQDTTVEMGATHIVARSHLISDFDQGFQNHAVLSSARRTSNEKPGQNTNRGGDYLGTGRGGLITNRKPVPEYLGIVRPVVVPAGTLIIMYYDTWHTARPSTLPCTLHLPPEERDPLQTRFFCKFRWWRMEEPTSPQWSTPYLEHNILAPFAPPVDAAFPSELRITPVTQAIFAYLGGYSYSREISSSPSVEGELSILGAAEPASVLLERLGWYSEAFACALDEEWRGPSPRNPPVVESTRQPATLASLCAAYVLATRGSDAWEALAQTALCGGVNVSPVRAIGNWAAYNASYGLASIVPTVEAIKTVAPHCIESLKGNPYALDPAALRVARDHASFVLGELLSAAIASDMLRPTHQAAGDIIDPLIQAATDAICTELYAPREDVKGASVPQYAAAIEAAGSLGQTLRMHYVHSEVGLDCVLALTAGLAHAHEMDMAVYKANVMRDPNRAGSGGIPHAAIALARLGVGEDARGVPLRLHNHEVDGTLNVPLIDKDKGLRFLLYAT